MTIPSGLTERIEHIDHLLEALYVTTDAVDDKADPDQLADFPMFVSGAIENLLVELDLLERHLAKLGLVPLEGRR